MSGDAETLAEAWHEHDDGLMWPDGDCDSCAGTEHHRRHYVIANGMLAAHDAAIRAEAKIEALEEYADELTWVQPEVSPCAPNYESCCGSEESCDAMRPSVRVVGAVSLRLRAAVLRAAQPTEACACADVLSEGRHTLTCRLNQRAAQPTEGECIAPPGNLCTETGCWDADRCVVRAQPTEGES